MIYLLGGAAPLFLCLGFTLQQHAAASAPASDFLRIRLLIDLLHKPIWIVGVLSMIAGQVLSAMALATADVSLVEPLLSANVLFALILARLLYHQPLGLREWSGSLVLSAGVGVFIWAGDPRGGDPDTDSLLRWVLAIGVLLLAQLCVGVAARSGRCCSRPPPVCSSGSKTGSPDGRPRRGMPESQRFSCTGRRTRSSPSALSPCCSRRAPSRPDACAPRCPSSPRPSR